ncbi:MAG: hypothetical protein IJ841_11080 [Prevotella sp.]|nr:hypothetical protein [Prevotella sp.]
MKTGRTIHYKVHPTPLKPGESVQTYHVRQVLKTTKHRRELAEEIARYGLVSVSVFELVIERLRREMAYQLRNGNDLHIDGIGRFSLQLGTKKVMGDDGRWHAKTYLSPEELNAREVTIEGMTFTPDKAMLSLLKDRGVHFVRQKEDYNQDIPRDQLLAVLDSYCQEHGSFTRQIFQMLFGVSRYRAQLMLDALVSEPSPLYLRQKFGPSYVYRKA